MVAKTIELLENQAEALAALNRNVRRLSGESVLTNQVPPVNPKGSEFEALSSLADTTPVPARQNGNNGHALQASPEKKLSPEMEVAKRQQARKQRYKVN